jgi:tetratricopeptide (TPR) repeat protein
VKLDDTLAEAHAALGAAMTSLRRYDSDTEAEFKRALQLNPRQVNAHYFYAESYLMPMGRLPEAEAELRKALELDPMSLIVHTNLALVIGYQRRYNEALAELRRVQELDANFPPMLFRMADLLEFQGDFTQALQVRQHWLMVVSKNPSKIARRDTGE